MKSYLAVCVANRARNANKAKQQRNVALDKVADMASNAPSPDQSVIHDEELQQLAETMQLLPYEQREAVTLHLQGGTKFKEIARLQNVSLKTVFSRYRYGLNKLRSILNSEVEK